MIEGIIAAVLGAIFGIGGTVVYEKRRQAAGKNKAEQEIAKAKIKAGDIGSLEGERRSFRA